jgi:hypothetical protein
MITASGAPGWRPDLSHDVCVHGVVPRSSRGLLLVSSTARWDARWVSNTDDIEAPDLPARAVWRLLSNVEFMSVCAGFSLYGSSATLPALYANGIISTSLAARLLLPLPLPTPLY